MKYALLLLLLLMCSIAMAGGDKVRSANPIIGDGCIYQVPPGLDLDQCEAINATSQSGKDIVVYYCDVDVVVICD
jgi:hypothetical protein